MSALSDALLKIVKQQVLRAIVAKVPLLGSGLLNPLLVYAVNHILKIAFKEAALQAYFVKVDLMTEYQAKKVREAQDKLSQANSEKEIEDAQNELKKRLKDLINFKP